MSGRKLGRVWERNGGDIRARAEEPAGAWDRRCAVRDSIVVVSWENHVSSVAETLHNAAKWRQERNSTFFAAMHLAIAAID